MDKNFLIKKISETALEKELFSIGFDSAYLSTAKEKYRSNLFKIFALTPVQATILKQTALSCGTDFAVHREVLTQNVEFTDGILFATNAQLKNIISKLFAQPFGLKILAQNLKNAFFDNEDFTIRNTVFSSKKTYIMGILNLTPDSFSDGGEFSNKENAAKHFSEMIAQGADIIDIGAESTAPVNPPIGAEEEILRLKDILPNCRNANSNIPISVDTRNAETAQIALKAGADIINDVSGLSYDRKMAQAISENDAFCVLTFDGEIKGENTLDETIKGLLQITEKAKEAGIQSSKIILDPGLGFNKTFEQNYELIKRADEICFLGFPVLYGLSRKSFVQKQTGLPPKETICANISLASYLAEKGVRILRVHDVSAHKIAFTALDKVLYD